MAVTRIFASVLSSVTGVPPGIPTDDDLAAVEEKLHAIACWVRACYSDDSQVFIRADETLCTLQRFKWELERG